MKFYLPSSNQSDFKAVDPCVNQRLLKTHELHFSFNDNSEEQGVFLKGLWQSVAWWIANLIALQWRVSGKLVDILLVFSFRKQVILFSIFYFSELYLISVSNFPEKTQPSKSYSGSFAILNLYLWFIKQYPK